MARKPLQLGRPDVAESIDELHRKEPPGWRKDRLLVIKLVTRGEAHLRFKGRFNVLRDRQSVKFRQAV
jgi:hypothetical protein